MSFFFIELYKTYQREYRYSKIKLLVFPKTEHSNETVKTGIRHHIFTRTSDDALKR